MARLGGDEFVVVTPGHRHEGDVRRLVGRISAALDLPYELEISDGRTVRVDVGASIGLALATTGDLRDPAAMLRDADSAMYVEKLARRA